MKIEKIELESRIQILEEEKYNLKITNRKLSSEKEGLQATIKNQRQIEEDLRKFIINFDTESKSGQKDNSSLKAVEQNN